MSGASARAIAHVGVLEVFKENNIPVDYIAACSSGALVAAAYCAGTMEELKAWIFQSDLSKLLNLWSIRNTKGGLFRIHGTGADDALYNIIKGLRFEEVYPKLSFVATDLNTGEMVVLNMGDIHTAFRATVAVPGLFEPVVWGDKILVDGGLSNIVPTIPVKKMGADIVIGIDLAPIRFLSKKALAVLRQFRFFKKALGIDLISKKVARRSDEDVRVPSIPTVVFKAMDHALTNSEKFKESDHACDLMLEPQIKHYGKIDFKNLEKIYLDGRTTAQAALPKIRKLIEKWQSEQKQDKLKRVQPAYDHSK